MRKLLVVLAAAVIGMSGSASSQTSEESILKEYRDNFKKSYFSVGILMQFVFDAQGERSLPGNNGFSVANMRLKLNGRLDRGFGYFFQTKFDKSPAILDAFISYQISPALVLRTGQFKTPFSREYLTSASELDFVDRSRVVSALAPGRQIGVQASGFLADDLLNYSAAVSNGNGTGANGNDNGDFLYTGRIALFPKLRTGDRGGTLEAGLNAAFSSDEDVTLAGGEIVDFSGDRFAAGFDVRFQDERLLLAGEYIRAVLEPDAGEEIKPDGFHATAGYMVRPKLQALVRWDRFDLDGLDGRDGASDWMVLGLNFWPTGISEFQFNYIIDLDEGDIERNQVLVNAQFAL